MLDVVNSVVRILRLCAEENVPDREWTAESLLREAANDGFSVGVCQMECRISEY
ncbi:hypothetical protein [Caproiciproducens sp. LBM24188]|nr:hypothetical protein [Clostridiales bacterium]